jgi:hypothetical protein
VEPGTGDHPRCIWRHSHRHDCGEYLADPLAQDWNADGCRGRTRIFSAIYVVGRWWRSTGALQGIAGGFFSGAINFCNSMDLGNVSSDQLCGHDSRGHRAALSRSTFSFSRISPRLRFFVHRIAALAMVCLRYISTFRSYMRGNGLSRLHAATNRESTRRQQNPRRLVPHSCTMTSAATKHADQDITSPTTTNRTRVVGERGRAAEAEDSINCRGEVDGPRGEGIARTGRRPVVGRLRRPEGGVDAGKSKTALRRGCFEDRIQFSEVRNTPIAVTRKTGLGAFSFVALAGHCQLGATHFLANSRIIDHS